MPEYDYVVIGAGSAGCVIANRLSEDKDTRVLLLEAGGPDKHVFIRVPLASSTLVGSEVDWAYQTTPQTHMLNRRIPWPRGKVLGGSSSINAMIYQRGHRYYYDHWAGLGNQGWSYDEVLPYFKKAQHQTRGESRYHGIHGPQYVTDLHEPHELSLAFVQAAEQAGYPTNHDFNGESQDGFGLFQVNQKGRMRHSAAHAYLHPALERPNLKAEIFAHVTKLGFEGTHCRSVTYLQDGISKTVSATREILLCGGAINSPHLLMLSGIGDPTELKAHGIPVITALPGVGKNLQDHLALPVSYRAKGTKTLDDLLKWHNQILPLLKYLLFKKGVGTSNGAEAGGFIQLSDAAPAPELQFTFTPVFGMLPDPSERPKGSGFTIAPVLVHVESRGALQLASADPFAPPLIDPNYLAQQADLDVLVQGVHHARSIGMSPAFERYRGEEVYPGSALQSQEALEDFVRQRATTLFHPVGTCKMGQDPMAVVDSSLRVHGVQGLRVVDASIMPLLINANTHSPTVMIAEKAADLIKQT